MPKYQLESGGMKMVEWLHVLTSFVRGKLVYHFSFHEGGRDMDKGRISFLALASFVKYLSLALVFLVLCVFSKIISKESFENIFNNRYTESRQSDAIRTHSLIDVTGS